MCTDRNIRLHLGKKKELKNVEHTGHAFWNSKRSDEKIYEQNSTVLSLLGLCAENEKNLSKLLQLSSDGGGNGVEGFIVSRLQSAERRKFTTISKAIKIKFKFDSRSCLIGYNLPKWKFYTILHES